MLITRTSVDVDELVSVTFRDGGKIKRLTAISCGYAVIELPTGRKAIAIEVVFDPNRQNPTTNYTTNNLRAMLIKPAAVQKIEPYKAVQHAARG